MIQANKRISNRRGAALIIALVLLLLVSAISASLIQGFYTDRRERDRSLIRTQAELLRQDFAGETLTLPHVSDSFPGTFQLTACENGVVVEYHDTTNTLVYTSSSN